MTTYTEKTENRIEIVDGKFVQVRAALITLKDGVEVGRQYHRHLITPGDDYSSQPADVRAICAVVHTPEVVTAFKKQVPVPA